jgi:hypothetical protein
VLCVDSLRHQPGPVPWPPLFIHVGGRSGRCSGCVLHVGCGGGGGMRREVWDPSQGMPCGRTTHVHSSCHVSLRADCTPAGDARKMTWQEVWGVCGGVHVTCSAHACD